MEEELSLQNQQNLDSKDIEIKFQFKQLDFSKNYYAINNKKNKKIILPTIEEIIKNAVKYSKKNIESCFIQFLIKATDENVDKNIRNKIFDLLQDSVYELSQDFFGNYVIQEFISIEDKEKNDYIFNLLN